MNIFHDPVFRASINEKDVLKLEISHLVSDGHSMNILAKDLFSLFTNKHLPALTVNYQNFNQIFIDSSKNEQNEFWSKLFENKNYSKMETDFIDKDFDYSSDSVFKTFTNANSALAKSVKIYHCSPLTLLLYSFAFRFREKLEDFFAPLKIAFCKDMRPSEEYYNCIGFFINTLIIPIEETDTIADIEQKVNTAQTYSWITVNELKNLITKDENESIFDVILVLDNSPTTIFPAEKLNGFRIIETKQTATKFDLTIFVQINGKDLNVKAEYRKNLWKNETIETFLNAWEFDGFEEKVPKISKALPEFNLSIENVISVDFDRRDITEILMEKFEKYGRNIALKIEDSEISYKELQKKLIKISENIKLEYFKAIGCLFGPDTIIPVISKNSIEQWLICLGVIFAGGAYLPIDEKTPEERILKILEQLEPTLIISDKNIFGFKTVILDKIKDVETETTSKFTVLSNPHNLAYIIFTSGTTGIPKGVCINRLGLSNLISDAQQFFSIDQNSVIYQFTSFCFDNSILEIFAALGSGATCFISDGFFASDKFCKQISDYSITHAMLFPGLVETFDDEELVQLKKLKFWICGAEKLTRRPSEMIFRFHNHFAIIR
uniref:Uncharacterized protein n=1 Tax=Panagrolaimus davidi TaxID=227884 RepID=A0A914Q1T4_9BILA